MKTFQLPGVLLLLLLSACSISNVEDFVVGDNFIKSSAGTVMIDTLTLQSSTVKIDSLASNASGRLLMGCNYNSFSGYKYADPYFEMQFGDAINYTTFDYDSLYLVLNYDKYYTGDTTVTQPFEVYQLSEQMALNNNYLYTTSYFPTFDFTLGTFDLAPHPQSKKEITVRLSDFIGKKLAGMLKRKSDTITTQSLFLEFFKGLTIKSPHDAKGAVLGISAPSSTSSTNDATSGTTTTTTSTTASGPEMRLYFHLNPNPNDLHGLYYKFTFYSDGIYYNQVTNNKASSMIGSIPESEYEISSQQTDNEVLVQSGMQTYAKIKIPYVDNLLWMGKNSGLVGASLRLYPVTGTYKRAADLPDSLYVYQADRKNVISSQIALPGNSNYAFAVKTVVKDVEEQVYYETDVTTFVSSELQQMLETDRSILVGFGSSTPKKTVMQLILGGANSGKFAPKLNVYYYHN